MRLSLILVIILSTTSVMAGVDAKESTQNIWLPIVATHPNVNDAFASVTKLESKGKELQLVDMNDCHNLRKSLYVVAAGIYNEQSAAKSAINTWRNIGVADAYLRNCEVVVPSRLSLEIPVIDPSFKQQSIEAVNWDIEDAISRVVDLGNNWVALIIPRYEVAPEDIREGLRIGVRLYNQGEKRLIDLSPDCIDPEFVLSPTHVALTCVNESAANYLLHRTQLNSLADGKLVAEENRCMKPVFSQNRWTCQEESIDADGVLELKPKVLNISKSKP